MTDKINSTSAMAERIRHLEIEIKKLKIEIAKRKVERLKVKESPIMSNYLLTTGKAADADKLDGLDSTAFSRVVFLTAPLTSTAWDGDARSTTAKTLIDLSSVFGAPAGIKGIFVRLTARDSGSSAGYCQLALSPNSTADSVAIQCYLQGVANDVYISANGVVPCNANGDVYYQITASGTGTLDALIEIWGYWL